MHTNITWAERTRARKEQNISRSCCQHCMDVAFAPLSSIPEGEFCGETQKCIDLIRNKSKWGHEKSPTRRALGKYCRQGDYTPVFLLCFFFRSPTAPCSWCIFYGVTVRSQSSITVEVGHFAETQEALFYVRGKLQCCCLQQRFCYTLHDPSVEASTPPLKTQTRKTTPWPPAAQGATKGCTQHNTMTCRLQRRKYIYTNLTRDLQRKKCWG